VNRRTPLFTSVPHAEQQAHHGHAHAFERRAARHRGAGQQPEQHDGEDLRRAELKRDADQQRRSEHHDQDAEGCSEERRDHGDAQRRTALALPGHRVAVQASDGVGRMRRHVEQDRADRAAVLRTVEDAGQHQDRWHWRHRVGYRQQDRHGRQRAHAGQHANHVADQHAEERPHQVMRL
jgi:hypothetical protein